MTMLVRPETRLAHALQTDAEVRVRYAKLKLHIGDLFITGHPRDPRQRRELSKMNHMAAEDGPRGAIRSHAASNLLFASGC